MVGPTLLLLLLTLGQVIHPVVSPALSFVDFRAGHPPGGVCWAQRHLFGCNLVDSNGESCNFFSWPRSDFRAGHFVQGKCQMHHSGAVICFSQKGIWLQLMVSTAIFFFFFVAQPLGQVILSRKIVQMHQRSI
jgi:hypothetical protein